MSGQADPRAVADASTRVAAASGTVLASAVRHPDDTVAASLCNKNALAERLYTTISDEDAAPSFKVSTDRYTTTVTSFSNATPLRATHVHTKQPAALLPGHRERNDQDDSKRVGTAELPVSGLNYGMPTTSSGTALPPVKPPSPNMIPAAFLMGGISTNSTTSRRVLALQRNNKRPASPLPVLLPSSPKNVSQHAVLPAIPISSATHTSVISDRENRSTVSSSSAQANPISFPPRTSTASKRQRQNYIPRKAIKNTSEKNITPSLETFRASTHVGGTPFDFITSLQHYSQASVTGSSRNGATTKTDDRLPSSSPNLEFVYLRPVKRNSATYNPYDLEIVEYESVDRGDFYTISTAGMTHYTNGYSEFTSLHQWIREHKLFHSMITIPFFTKYRTWKNFSVWRKNVRRAKVTITRKLLSKNLVFLDPILQHALNEIKSLSAVLAQQRLLSLDNTTTYTLIEFTDRQDEWLDGSIKDILNEYADSARVLIECACEASLKRFGCPVVITANGENEAGEKLTFTQLAARRAECRRLQRFVRVADYIIVHTLLGLAIASISDFLQTLINRYQDNKVIAEVEDQDHLLANVQTSHLLAYGMEALMGVTTKMNDSGPTTNIRLALTDLATTSTSEAVTINEDISEVRHASYMSALSDALPLFSSRTRPSPLFRTEILMHENNLRLSLGVLASFDNLSPDPGKNGAEASIISFTPNKADFFAVADNLVKKIVSSVEGVQLLTSSISFLTSGDRFEEPEFTEALNTPVVIFDSVYFQALCFRIRGVLRGNFEDAEALALSFEPYRQMYTENACMNLDDVANGILVLPGLDPHDPTAVGLSLPFFELALNKYTQQRQQIEQLPAETIVSNILIDSQNLKQMILPSPKRCFDEITKLLPVLARDKNEALLSEINYSVRMFASASQSVEAFVDYLNHLDLVKGKMDTYEEAYQGVSKLYRLIEQYKIVITPTELALYQTLRPTMRQLKDAVDLAEESREESTTRFASELEKNSAELVADVIKQRNRAQDGMILSASSSAKEVMAFLNELDESMSTLVASAEKYAQYQAIFKVQPTKYVEIEDTKNDLALKKLLWTSFGEWDRLTSEWESQPFERLTTEEINTQINSFMKTVYALDKGLPPNEVVPRLKQMVEVYRGMYPTIVDLRNPSLRLRHWEKIQEAIGHQLVRDETLTLAMLKNANVFRFKEELQQIASQASSEAALEEMLQKVVKMWAETEVVVLPYKDSKDVFILGGVEEIQALLEDSQVTIATLKASRHLGPIKSEVDKWDHQLLLFSETLEAWLTCQRNWMYLESIFSAPDIQRQLPDEAKMFSQVDRGWKDIMRKTHRNPNAIKAGTAPGTLELLTQNNELLDKIQKCLEEYLESKRLLFPRFYFLSNDELLEILSQTKNPQAVQPHLGKCFDAIKSLEFAGESKSIDVVAMVSPEGERTSFVKSLKARGNVEGWLSAVEEAMFATVRKLLKTALAEYDDKNRMSWLLQHAGQVILTASQVIWSNNVTQCLMSPKPLDALRLFSTRSISNLTQLAAIVRGDLTRLQRAILGALITIDVHARDIVIGMINANVSSVGDFEWMKQLRYYWNSDEDTCQVKMSNTSFNYGCEYLGCSSRLVITPLTDRCYLTLTGALAINLGGSPVGPAGTGKTETVKDLAKALARQCVVYNCSDQLDYKMMGKFFAGLAQSGAWCCFDEFNRIDIEVLSVIAQQLLTIKYAKDMRAARFVFEGKDIRLIDTCAAFITMNPGYAGRTELPDNLKALFRPIAMMIPDYGLIAEIMLYSEGFEDAKMLAGKVVNMYKLCSEQLSQQDHYDFGMRAVKSVLVMAGQLKRANPTISENVVLIRSLRDSNLPKFLAEDVPLFLGILQDLFPNVVIPDQDFGTLKSVIEEVLSVSKLISVPKYLDRIIQLYDTTRVRHGVMLVGPTGGGKTVSYQTLASSLTLLRERDHPNQDYQKIQTTVLNPKCITMDELYGAFNLATMEWRDGLIGSITRVQVSDATIDEKWTVFDGPVDALWIENMNTVLDDNKLLCLSNGERIKLDNTMHMMFEVSDLAVASPATVSRCGMVYMDPSNLGWRPYVQTWMCSLPTQAYPEFNELLTALFDANVDLGLRFVRKQGKELVPSVDLNLVVSLCRLLEIFIRDQQYLDLNQSVADLKPMLAHIFIFCYVWSIGGNLTDSVHDAFDTFARELFAQGDTVDAPLPSDSTIFGFVVDARQKTFVPWDELVPTFQFSSDVPFFQMMVPTVDTVRYQYLIDRLIQASFPTLITGVAGVGKSVVIQDLLTRVSKQHSYISVNLNYSAQTSSSMTQQYFEGKLEKKRKNTLGAPHDSRVIVFIDDLNMPKPDTYGAQPPVELLRQFLDFKGFYDREKLFWKTIEDITLITACAPPGGGRNVVTPRLLRHFNMLNIPMPSDSSLARIFRSIVDGFMKPFSSEIRSCAEAIVMSSIELFNRMCTELLPTPAKSHYTFNLRDLSKVIQGMLQIRPQKITTKQDITRVYCHETARVFHDRLIEDGDRRYFNQLLSELVEKSFGVQIAPETLMKEPILFGDFGKRGVPQEEREYVEFVDHKALGALLDDYLEEYNVTLSKDMRLIFFLDAKQHMTRISRILRQPRGNALLVGIGGTGKKSLTKLACHISEYECNEIELTRTYGVNEWREDIKRMYQSAGVEGKHTVFLLFDTQIKQESFLEDINNILNTGDVPSLFELDEREKIIGDLRQAALDKGLPEDRDSVYQFFISRVRDNLHIVFATSPVGETFRNRCRMFPSLVNCCTIDWFNEWPSDALLSVSKRFFEFIDLGSTDMKERISEMCVDIHISVTSMSVRFYAELKRRYYTTPTSYLELINLYIGLLQEKRKELGSSRDRLQSGLQKLSETNELVASMQITLEQLEPELTQKAADVETLMIKIAKDQELADGVRKTVAEEEAVVKEQAAQTEAIARDAQRDLDEALPALEAAYKALDSLEKKDVAEMRAFTKPPELVMTVMEAVCILFKMKADWDTSKKLLGDSQLLRKIQEYDKDSVTDTLAKKLKKYIENPNFTPEAVEKVSRAARSMCLWVLAIDIYTRVSKEVAPKRKRLDEAQKSLETTRAKLAEKTKQLQEVEDQLNNLKKQFDESVESKRQLADKMEQTTQRLQRASKLTTALADEQIRWTDSVSYLNQQIDDLVGNIFLAAACVAYCGAFTSNYRHDLVQGWVARCKELGIPVSESFSLTEQLADPSRIREWNVQGLPADSISTENGILVTRGRRWPLMIDPQGQANRWIRNMEGSALKVIKLSESKFLRSLENAVRAGQPVLLEDVGESLDPALEPLLLKQTTRQGGRLLMKLGDSLVEYDRNFRLYITTKLPNPHYYPEVCIKVTIINFTVTKIGLEGQLLADVVRLERAELEEQRNSLIVNISNDKKQLQDIEEKILRLLYNSQGNILDDEELLTTLNQSKITSGVITKRVKLAEQTEREINTARERYRPVALRGSLLYFTVADLAEIDPMYQFSLKYFKNLFTQVIIDSEKGYDLETHITILCQDITFNVFSNVSRGLFEQHKLIFSFMMCVEIMRNRNDIAYNEWSFFLRGGNSLELTTLPPKPVTQWLTDSVWRNCCELAASVPIFGYLSEHIAMNASDWEDLVESETPMETIIPGIAQDKLTLFQRLLIVKVLREERLIPAVMSYIQNNLAPEYVDIPPLDLSKVYNDLNNVTPLVFILSTGSDPVSGLLKLATTMKCADRINIISLGQGQGPIAEAILQKALISGDWVFLQNCHLAASWMPRLEQIVKDVTSSSSSAVTVGDVDGGVQIHKGFRLFLSSMPSKVFPISVLQESVKITNEPPKGLRANLARSFADISPSLFDTSPPQGMRFRKLAFGLCYFNAIIHERKKFGPLGWNILYDWSNSDLEVSVVMLRNLLEQATTIPWDALRYLTGEIAFGGRVTDEWDRRTLVTTLNKYYTNNILDDNYRFSTSNAYYAPPDGDLASFRSFIDRLPFDEESSVFGMHPNANISYQVQETKRLVRTVLDVQPRLISAGGGSSSEDQVMVLANTILGTWPEPLVVELPSSIPRVGSALKERPKNPLADTLFKIDEFGRMVNSLSTVLYQESERFNRLLRVVKASLENLIKAIKGMIVMSSQLELVFNSLLNNEVPAAWAHVAYPSLKPLSSWVLDFHARVRFMNDWINKGQPRTFWLPGFFFPQGFLTGVFQNHARKYAIPIDTLKFSYYVQDVEQIEDYPQGEIAVDVAEKDGVSVKGLFIEGARWDRNKKSLQDSFPMEMYSTMPLIRFIPTINVDAKLMPCYTAPLYKTSARAGTLSTTGHSTNFVVAMYLPSDKASDYWIAKGVALLMQRNE